MANQRNYQIKIGFSTDNTTLAQLQQNLKAIIDLAKQPGNELNRELQEAAQKAKLISDITKNSFNSKTNTLNIAKMNKELEKSGESLSTIYTSFSKIGAEGANVYNTIAGAALRANYQIKESNKLLDSFAISMANTVKWGITSGIWNTVTNSLSGAVTYVEKLDHSLNDIRIVTQKNAAAMREFAKEANSAAQILGASTTDYTDAALIYYQQGLAEAEVKARTEVTLKTANVTRQSTDEVSEQLTAVWNGYKVSAQEAELYVDKLAAVAATTAADLEELSTGMSKVASAASAMGVDVDQLSAQLATIVSVTRQAPESVGTALKTIYARMGDLAIGEEDEFGVTLGTVSGQLAQVGIAVLDQTGNLRDMGLVMEEVAAKWDMWNDSQKTAVAIAMAGKRQYNNLIALFNNWDMYSDALTTSENAMGTLSKQQATYLESTDARLQKVTTSWEKLYSTLIDTDELNTGIDLINQLVQSFDNLASSFGGGIKTIGAAVAILASLGSKKIGEGLIQRSKNLYIEDMNASTAKIRNEVRELGIIESFGSYEDLKATGRIEENAKKGRDFIAQYDQVRAGLTNEQYMQVLETAKQISDLGYSTQEQLLKNEAEIDNINDLLEESQNLTEEIVRLEELQSKSKKGLTKTQKSQLDNLKNQHKNLIDNNKKILNSDGELKDSAKERLKYLKEQNVIINKNAQATEQDLRNSLELELGDQEQLQKQQNMQLQLNALAGSFQLVAASIMSVNSIADIWFSDNNLSFTEKLTQSIFSLGPALALARSGFRKLNDETLKGKTISDIFSASKVKQTLATIFGTKAKIADTKATEDNTKKTLANAGADSLEATTEMASGKADLISTGTKIASSGGLGTKLAGIGAKLGGVTVGVAAAALAATVAIVAIARSVAKQNAKKDLEQATKEAEAAMKKVTETKEATNKVNSFANAVKNLSSEIDTQGEYTSELRNKVHALAIEYEQTDLAVKSLAMSYGELKDAATQAQIEQNNKLIEDTENAQKLLVKQTDASIANFNTNRGWFESMIGQWGISEGVEYTWANSKTEKAFLEELDKLKGIKIDESGVGGEILITDFEAFAEEYKVFQEILLDYNRDLSGHNVLKAAQSLQANSEKTVEEYLENLNLINEAVKQNALLTTNIDKESIKTTEDYLQKRKEVFNKIKDSFDEEKEAYQWIQNQIGSLGEETRKAMISGEIALDLATAENQLSGLTQLIQSWSEDERNFIYLHLDKVSTLAEAEELLEEFENYFKLASANKGLTLIDSLLETSGTLTSEQIEGLYKNSNFAQETGITNSIFALLSESEQKRTMLQYSFDNLSYIMENQAIIEEELQNKLLEFQEANSQVVLDYQYATDNLIQGFSSIVAQSTLPQEMKDRFTEEYILQLIRNRNNLIEGSQEAKDYDLYVKMSGTEDKVISAVEAWDEYNKRVNIYNNSISEVNNLQDDWAELLEKSTNELERQKSSLNNMNSAYDTLTGIVGSYNETGKFTLDNLVSLMSLESEYIALLSWEDGQLKLNEESMKNLALAKLQDAKATIVQQGSIQLANLAEQTTKVVTEEINGALTEQTAQLYTTATAWEKYANSVWGGIMANESAKNIRDSVATQLESIDKIIAEINLNGIGAAMGEEIAEAITKVWDEEFDRYWTQNKIIEKLNDTLEDLRDIREHLSNDELRANLETENTLIKEQVENYEELLAAQKKEQKELQSELKGYGVKFNQAGEIINYEAVTKAQTDKMNNAGNEDAEEYFDSFKNALERYDDLFYDEMKNTLDEIEELTEQMIDNNFEIWTSQMDNMLEKFEDERDLNDYNAEMVKDFKQVYEDLGLVKNNLEKNFTSLATDTIPTIIMDMQKAESEIAAIAAGASSDMFHSMSQAQEYLKEKQEALRDAALETKEVYEDLYNTYLDQIDQAIDKMDDLYNEFNRINESLEYQAELIELVYGEKAYSLYSALYDAQLHTSNEQLASLIQEKKVYEELYAQAEEGTQDQLKYKERLYELESQINDKVIEHIELLKKDYSNTVEEILNDLENQLTGGIGLDNLEDEWDRIKEKADKYYDTVEGLYQIQTLGNKITQSINTASVNGQKKLQKLYDKEIEYLREKKNLTEYDIQAAEARYQITLKEIALEESRMNKNTMKLVRDASGNWTYQYVANQEEVINKQQDLLDAYQKLYDLADNAYTKNIDALFALNRDYLEAAREIANDSTLTEEERVQKLEQLRDRYLKDYKILVEENELYSNDLAKAYTGNLVTLFTTNNENINGMSSDEKLLVKGMVSENIIEFGKLETYFASTGDNSLRAKMIKVMQDGYDSWNTSAQNMIALWNGSGGEGQISIESAINTATSNIIGEIGEVELKINSLAELVNQKFNSEEGVIDSFNDAKDAATQIAEKIDEILPGIKENLNDFATAVSSISTAWDGVNTSVQNAINKYIEFMSMEDPLTKTVQIITEYIEHGSGGSTEVDVDNDGDLEFYEPDGIKEPDIDEPEPDNNSNGNGKTLNVPVGGAGLGGGMIGAAGVPMPNPLAGQIITPSDELMSAIEISATRGEYSKKQEELSKEAEQREELEDIEDLTNANNLLNQIYSPIKTPNYTPTPAPAPTPTPVPSTSVSTPAPSTSVPTLYDPAILSENAWNAKYNSNSANYNSNSNIDKPLKDSNSNGNTDKKSFGEKAIDVLENIGGWIYERQQMGFSLFGYDTGGYTGDWNSTSGRIALLHQKELVLNQADTKNILAAVSTMRSITGLNSSVNDAIMRGISKMMLEMSNINTHANYNTEASQSVGDTIYEIHAEFPDANDVNSIREAILSLPNLASQRVSKYNTP